MKADRYKKFFELSADAILIIAGKRFIDCNQAAMKMLRYESKKALLNTHPAQLSPERQPDGRLSSDKADEMIDKAFATGSNRFEWLHKRADGEVFPVEVLLTAIDEGEEKILHVSWRDITERKRAEEDLRIAATVFESQEGMVVTDTEATILRVNKAFCLTTGYTAEELVGQNPRIIQSDRHDKKFFQQMWESILTTGAWQGEVWDRHKNGEVYPKWLTISTVKDDNDVVTHYVGTHFDITERKKAEDRIRELAFYDQLTDLPNRSLMMDRLRQVLEMTSRDPSNSALLFLDLDHFKNLNDSQGHDMGDLLLQQVAGRLLSCVRAVDTVARLGGDEFVIILLGLSDDGDEAAAQTEKVGEKILNRLAEPYQLAGQSYTCTASIGTTLFVGGDVSPDDILKQADLAMYKAKAQGRHRLRFFNPVMETTIKQRAALEADLRAALQRRQFVLYFQPQLGRDDRLTGVEALVRWQHPERGMVSPANFIPLAEETGLILPLGNWVLAEACASLARWAKQPNLAHLIMSVNVSAKQFHLDDFVDQVLDTVAESGANPHLLKLELTESMLVEDIASVISKMNILKGRGINFSLDDFGTGYSSLAYLKRLPLEQLKIDRSFVTDVLTDPNAAAIARTVVALAYSLGLKVIAEGVETQRQRDYLAQAGCFAYQGYLFSPPVPEADLTKLVARQGKANG